MVHPDEGDARRPSRRLGEGHAHHEGAHQAGGVGNCDRVQVAPAQTLPSQAVRRVFQAYLCDAADGLDMLPACDFGDHAAEAGMEVDLARHGIGQDGALPVHHGGGRLIAGRFDGQDERVAFAAGPEALRTRGFARLVHLQFHAGDIARHQGKRAGEDEGIFAVGIVTRAPALVFQAQADVEGLRTLVGCAHLERCLAGTQIARVGSDAAHQVAGDAQTAPFGVAAHLQDLQPAVNHPAASVAHKRAVGPVERSPPGAVLAL